MLNEPQTTNKVNRIYIFGEIDSSVSLQVIHQLNFPVPHEIVINSKGGSIPAALSIVDAILETEQPVSTIGIGEVCSAALPILAVGDKGKRRVTNNCIGMHHHGIVVPEDGLTQRDHLAIKKWAEVMELKFARLMAQISAMNESWWMDRGKNDAEFWFDSVAFLEYGLVDKCVTLAPMKVGSHYPSLDPRNATHE